MIEEIIIIEVRIPEIKVSIVIVQKMEEIILKQIIKKILEIMIIKEIITMKMIDFTEEEEVDTGMEGKAIINPFQFLSLRLDLY